jgi:ribosomal protein S6--L-glutamate ligase
MPGAWGTAQIAGHLTSDTQTMNRVAVITDKAEHEVLREVAQRLDARFLLTGADINLRTAASGERARPAEVYLLKAHSRKALALAMQLQRRGARVINSPYATAAAQDRLRMAIHLDRAGIAQPALVGHGSLEHLYRTGLPQYPVVVKSDVSRRGDLVTVVRSRDEMASLLAEWATEPVVVQEYIVNTGWDVKLWVVGGTVFAARRPSALYESNRFTLPVASEDMPSAWRQITATVGRVFDLELFGVDILETRGGPVVVDVNAFPGYRGIPGAAQAIAQWVETLVSPTALRGSCGTCDPRVGRSQAA